MDVHGAPLIEHFQVRDATVFPRRRSHAPMSNCMTPPRVWHWLRRSRSIGRYPVDNYVVRAGIDDLCVHSWSPLQKTAERFSTVATRSTHFVFELALAPRRVTTRIPFVDQPEGVLVGEQEPANKAAARTERLDVTVLPGNGGRQSRQIPPRALHDRCRSIRYRCPQRSVGGRRHPRRGKVERCIHARRSRVLRAD